MHNAKNKMQRTAETQSRPPFEGKKSSVAPLEYKFVSENPGIEFRSSLQKRQRHRTSSIIQTNEPTCAPSADSSPTQSSLPSPPSAKKTAIPALGSQNILHSGTDALEKALNDAVLGQRSAIEYVITRLPELWSSKKPEEHAETPSPCSRSRKTSASALIFNFIGETGVGKSKLCQELAKLLDLSHATGTHLILNAHEMVRRGSGRRISGSPAGDKEEDGTPRIDFPPLPPVVGLCNALRGCLGVRERSIRGLRVASVFSDATATILPPIRTIFCAERQKRLRHEDERPCEPPKKRRACRKLDYLRSSDGDVGESESESEGERDDIDVDVDVDPQPIVVVGSNDRGGNDNNVVLLLQVEEARFVNLEIASAIASLATLGEVTDEWDRRLVLPEKTVLLVAYVTTVRSFSASADLPEGNPKKTSNRGEPEETTRKEPFAGSHSVPTNEKKKPGWRPSHRTPAGSPRKFDAASRCAITFAGNVVSESSRIGAVERYLLDRASESASGFGVDRESLRSLGEFVAFEPVKEACLRWMVRNRLSELVNLDTSSPNPKPDETHVELHDVRDVLSDSRQKFACYLSRRHCEAVVDHVANRYEADSRAAGRPPGGYRYVETMVGVLVKMVFSQCKAQALEFLRRRWYDAEVSNFELEALIRFETRTVVAETTTTTTTTPSPSGGGNDDDGDGVFQPRCTLVCAVKIYKTEKVAMTGGRSSDFGTTTVVCESELPR
jgi:hypothetical protein